MMQIYKEFHFDAAHSLPHVPDTHKCRRIHGHTYKVRVTLRGEVDPHFGWIEDFGQIREICKPVIDQLDHYYLNDIPGLENPTAEVIAKWMWDRIHPLMPALYEIHLMETPTSGCIYRGG